MVALMDNGELCVVEGDVDLTSWVALSRKIECSNVLHPDLKQVTESVPSPTTWKIPLDL